MFAQVQIHGESSEPRLAVRGEGRDQILTAELEVPEGMIGELTGKREQSVFAPAEIAVEFGIESPSPKSQVQFVASLMFPVKLNT